MTEQRQRAGDKEIYIVIIVFYLFDMKSELYGGFVNLLLRSPGRDGVLEAVGAC